MKKKIPNIMLILVGAFLTIRFLFDIEEVAETTSWLFAAFILCIPLTVMIAGINFLIKGK